MSEESQEAEVMSSTTNVGDDRPLISTGDYLKNRARQLHAELNRQAAYVRRMPKNRQIEWSELRKRWQAWYSAGPAWHWGSTGHTLDDYAREIGAWSVELQTHGGKPPVSTPEASESFTASLTPFLWVGAGLLAFKYLGPVLGVRRVRR